MGGARVNTLQSIWNGLDWSYLLNIVLSVVPSLLCITFHEVSHGYVAYRLGDTTAKDAGRLTLNPLKHIDPMGLLMMVVFKFGWAKPVPVNPNYFKKPKQGMALTALAGPVSNFLLALLMLLAARIFCDVAAYSEANQRILDFLLMVALLSIGLGLFNLLPIPPLDGSKVVAILLPDRLYVQLMRYERYGMILLLLLSWLGLTGNLIGNAIMGVYCFLLNLFF